MDVLRRLALVALAGAGAAQQSAPAVGDDRTTLEQARKAIAAWMGAAKRADGLHEKATRAVLDVGPKAMQVVGAWLARRRTPTTPAEKEERYRAHKLLQQICVDFMRRALDSEMVFAGQYDDLRALQPWSGEFLLQVAIEPPDWFPVDNRVFVVPALRDLYAKAPDQGAMQELREIARDEDFESEPLRIQLGYALAQWGDSSLIAARVKEIRDRTTSESGEDRLGALREYADLLYNLRDYDKAGRVHVQLLRLAEKEKLRLSPSDYYNAACNLSLSDDSARALDELERCVKLMKSGNVDESMLLDRKLFEHDPDIRSIRKTKRFAELFKLAFGDKKSNG